MFVEMFQFDFIIRAFQAGLLLAVIAPIIGVFLVVRRYSLLADALSHVSLMGVAIGFLLKLNPVLTALFVSAAAALGIERLRQKQKMFGESVLAVFLSGSLAIAVVLIGMAKGFNVNLLNFLFGSLSTVRESDVWLIGSLSLVVVAFCTIFYRQLFLISLDEDLAKVSGVSVNMLNTILVILAACTVALAMQMVGVLLVGALMVMPVLAAMQVAKSFLQTFGFALFFSILSVITGLFLSYALNIASGGAIVLVSLCFFLLSLLFPKQG
ncbi:MAG: metal ABC transporter permease [Candidatus Moranbacteria bacterium]|nr:metal ABC transporter permease [Candidatus Moranbacteria bacterium]